MFTEILKMHYIINLNEFCSNVDIDRETNLTADLCSKNFLRIFFRGYALVAGDMTVGKFISKDVLLLYLILFNA